MWLGKCIGRHPKAATLREQKLIDEGSKQLNHTRERVKGNRIGTLSKGTGDSTCCYRQQQGHYIYQILEAI